MPWSPLRSRLALHAALVLLRRRSDDFKELDIVVLRHGLSVLPKRGQCGYLSLGEAAVGDEYGSRSDGSTRVLAMLRLLATALGIAFGSLGALLTAGCQQPRAQAERVSPRGTPETRP